MRHYPESVKSVARVRLRRRREVATDVDLSRTMRGDPEQAEVYFRTVLELDPGNERAKRILERLRTPSVVSR